MECQHAIETLERSFDEGIAFTPVLKAHLADCAACRAKAESLESLERMLYVLPIDAPEGIENRVKAALIQEHAQQKRPILIAAVAACVFFCAGVVNWLLPLMEYEEKTWGYLTAWIPDSAWLGSGLSYREQFEQAWTSGLGMVEQMDWFSAPVLWSILATTLVLLVVLNGVCVTQMRHTHR